MKKLIALLILVMLVLIGVGCQQQSGIIKNINYKSKNTNKFISVALLKYHKLRQGRFAIKQGNKYWGFTIYFRDDIILSNDYENVDNLVKLIQYGLWDFGKKSSVNETIRYEGDIKKKDSQTFDKGYKQLTKIPSTWGEVDLSGINIQVDNLTSMQQGNVKINDIKWETIEGKYNLDNSKKTLVGHKGIFKSWYSSTKNSTIELYKNESGQQVISRRIWFDEKPIISFNERNKEKLVQTFFHYYKKAKFKDFIDEGYLQDVELQ